MKIANQLKAKVVHKILPISTIPVIPITRNPHPHNIAEIING
ncbi:hypothetical protein [Okeania sp. SIO2B3]|nr:hypothetical protein [Okeania sp. SIO2B3]